VVSDTSFEALMAEHHGEIYRYLLRATGRRPDADDLCQETFLRAFRAHRSLPPGANARAWLFAIATNLSKNHYRSQSRRRRAYAAVSWTAPSTDGAGPDRATIAVETTSRVEAIVERLPLKQRLAFVQRKLHGLEYDVIGANLGCSPDSARAHVFQALRKIRQGLEGSGVRVEERVS
jgi:RNA polymerase sigma-70 factor (ECF subfamily)